MSTNFAPMTAKEIQFAFIKTYLKPILKQYGYNNSGQNWWKNMGNFFIVINLQNSQWNSADELSFCLNIGVALTNRLADKEKKKATYQDIITNLRHSDYLTEDRKKNNQSICGGLGYRVTKRTNLEAFIKEFKVDFESYILIILEDLKSLNDCISFYKKHVFWGDQLVRQIQLSGLSVE